MAAVMDVPRLTTRGIRLDIQMAGRRFFLLERQRDYENLHR